MLCYLQIAFTAKKWWFVFPEEGDALFPHVCRFIGHGAGITQLSHQCRRTGWAPSPAHAAEAMQRPRADVLHISSLNAHRESCPFSPTTAKLQGVHEQTPPGKKGIQHMRGSVTRTSRRNPQCRGVSRGAIPTAPPRSGVWATTAEQTSLQGMHFLALSLLTLQISTSTKSWGIAFELSSQFSGAMSRSARSTSRLALQVPR